MERREIKSFAEWVREQEGLGPQERWDQRMMYVDLNKAYEKLASYIDGYFTYVATEKMKE